MIVVTGGAGFIGANLIAELEQRAAAVVVCDRMGSDEKRRNIAKRIAIRMALLLRSSLLEQLDDFCVATSASFSPNHPDPFFQLFSRSGEAHYP